MARLGREVGVTAGVALPLIKAGTSVGVLLFFVSKSWAADEEVIALMARIAENVSVALDNFDRAVRESEDRSTKGASGADARGAERDQRSDHAREITHRDVRTGLRGGRSRRQIQLDDHRACRDPPPNSFASSRPGTEGKRERIWKLPLRTGCRKGRGLAGTAFRTRRPCISNDFLADEGTTLWHHKARRSGMRSSAALPCSMATASRAR